MTNTSSSSVLDVVIRDIKPIAGERHIGTIQPGITVVRGGNGAGKSTTCRLIRLATSGGRAKPEEFAIADGAAKGWLRFGGRTLVIQRDGSLNRKGDAPTAEAVPDYVRDLDDPGLVGAEPRANARLRALCQAFGVEPNIQTIRRLLPAGPGEASDEAAVLWQAIRAAADPVLTALERVPAASVPAAAMRLKAALQSYRQQHEKELAFEANDATLKADRATRAAEALAADAGDELAEITDADALRAQEAAARAEVVRLRTEYEAGRRATAERELWRDQVAAVAVDERPMLRQQQTEARVRWDAADSGAQAAERQIANLEQEIATWREKRAAKLAEKVAQANILADVERRLAEAEVAQKRAATFKEKLAAAAGPAVEADDVELAESGLEKATRLLAYRRRQDEADALEAAAKEAERQRAERAARVEQIHAVDQDVWRRLGEILAEHLGGKARVVDGRVEALAPDGEWRDLDHRAFSQGQRAELTLQLMIDGAAAGGEVRVVVDETGDCPIDDDGLKRLSPAAARKGLAIVLEKELAGAELRLDYMGGA